MLYGITPGAAIASGIGQTGWFVSWPPGGNTTRPGELMGNMIRLRLRNAKGAAYAGYFRRHWNHAGGRQVPIKQERWEYANTPNQTAGQPVHIQLGRR